MQTPHLKQTETDDSKPEIRNHERRTRDKSEQFYDSALFIEMKWTKHKKENR